MESFFFYSSTFACAAIGTLALTPVAIRFARSCNLMDQPETRKVHTTPTPRIGGAALIFSTLITVGLAVFASRFFTTGFASTRFAAAGVILAAASGVFLIGLADDLINVSSKWKLLVLMTAATAVMAAGIRVKVLGTSVGMSVQLGLLSWIATLLWLVVVPVSLNFIDGLDGLAGGVTLCASLSLAIAAALCGAATPAILALALAGALLGFLRYNFRPARIFMGDGGSMFIGFLLACTTVLAASEIGLRRGILLPACALAVPLMDTALTILRRSVLQRRSLFSAERGHVHHRLLDGGLDHFHAVLAIYAISAVCALVGFVVGFAKLEIATFALGAAFVFAAAFFRSAGSTRVKETFAAFRRNRGISQEASRCQSIFDEMQTRFKAAMTFTAWWEEVCTAAAMLDFTEVLLPLVNRDGSSRPMRWAHPRPELEQSQLMEATVPVHDRRIGGQLQAQVQIAAVTSLESAGRKLSFFFRLLAEHGLADLPDSLPTAAPISAQLKSDSEIDSDCEDDVAECVNPLGKGVRVALVHDFLYTYAGAERVLEQILRVFPDAEVFSLFDFVPPHRRGFLRGKKVHTSFLQRMPFARKRHRAYLPLMPLAIEQLDVAAFDVVISSSYLAAKGVLTRPDQLHICYCHSPARFAWDLQNQYLGRAGLTSGLRSLMARTLLHYIRIWDTRSSNGVDKFLTNSAFVSRRVEKVYRRHSTPLYPPVDVHKFTLCEEKEDFYVTASRMVPYKRIDLIVEAFTKMPEKRLLVIGEGPDDAKLKAIAGPNVRFVGHQPFDRLKTLMQRARAFVFAAEEDFGIVPVEAQACGTPVIAFGRGGVIESVVDGKTGVFFREQTSASLIAAVKRFEQMDWDYRAIRRNAEQFSPQRFCQEFATLMEIEWSQFEAAQTARAGSGLRLTTGNDLGLGATAAASLLRAASERHAGAEASVG